MEEDDCREFEYCIWDESECLFVDDNDDEEEDFEGCNELTQEECSDTEDCIWMFNDFAGDFGICIEVNGDDGGWNDDGGDFEDCAELTQGECTMSEFCDWTIVTTPNGVFETCIESNDWNDDGGWDDGGNNIVCSDINNPFECIGSGCQWVGGNIPGAGYCIEESNEDCDPDLMCGGAITCVDGLLYPTTCGPDNCDDPIGECEEDECENGEVNNENPCNPLL